MSKIVQHLSPISRMPRCLMTATLLTALAFVPAVVLAQEAPSTHFEVLHRFHGGDGEFVLGGVILDAAGNLYGGAFIGGDFNCSYNPGGGCGTVFQLSTTGQEKVLHKFTGPDGLGPFWGGRLSQDSKGNLYGLTYAGGDSSCSSTGCGTVFKIDTTGKRTVLHRFTGSNGDGAFPNGGVILDASGNLYGTTSNGGAGGVGTVFKIGKTGQETVLYSFQNSGGDGGLPWGLVEDAAGNFYGATPAGGITGGPCGQYAGCGVVFKLDTTGKETVLYKFTGANGDGKDPYCTLVLDKQGNLYGTTSTGGKGVDGSGTVFKLTKTGDETILHRFNGSDGYQPFGPVVFDGAGDLYGTTLQGGSFGYGTVFKLTTAGKYTVLHNFSGGKDGAQPLWGVTIDGAGHLYGTTQLGGDLKCAVKGQGQGCGVVFKITP